MNDEQPRQVRTGDDPRSLSEFMALRDEMFCAGNIFSTHLGISLKEKQ